MTIFDAIELQEKPPLPMPRLDFVYSKLLPTINEGTVRALAKGWAIRSQPVTCLDLETVDALTYGATLAWWRSEQPETPLGIFGPGTGMAHFVASDRARMQRLLAARCEEQAALWPACDFLAPSLYCPVGLRAVAWETFAREVLIQCQAWQPDVPIYPVLSPYSRYDASLPVLPMVDPVTWRVMLDFVERYADGTIIWTGRSHHGPLAWDETAAWWRKLKERL